MNIRDALDQVDALKPNQFDEQQKIYWLSQVDQRIYNDVVLRHERDESMPETFGGYPPDVDQDTQLLASAPFDALYRWWLEAMIDLGNGELGKYQNSMLLFNSAWNDFAKDYRRKHMPLGQQKIGFTAGGRKPCGATGDAMDQLTQATQDANKAAFSAQLIAQTLREKLDSGELKGEKGDTGPAGATGPAGPQGPKGEPGESGGGSVTAESIAAALGYTPANPADFALDTNHSLTNLFPDNITALVNQFCKFGNVCMFTYQISVKTAISGDYGLTLAQLPFASAVRMWLNNGWQFYVEQGEKNIRLNGDNLAAGNYMLSGIYITTD